MLHSQEFLYYSSHWNPIYSRAIHKPRHGGSLEREGEEEIKRITSFMTKLLPRKLLEADSISGTDVAGPSSLIRAPNPLVLFTQLS